MVHSRKVWGFYVWCCSVIDNQLNNKDICNYVGDCAYVMCVMKVNVYWWCYCYDLLVMFVVILEIRVGVVWFCSYILFMFDSCDKYVSININSALLFSYFLICNVKILIKTYFIIKFTTNLRGKYFS